MATLTYREIIEKGEVGDKPLNIKLTARQLAALELIVDAALDYGIGQLTLLGAQEGYGADFAALLRIEFARSQARIGIELNRVLGNPEVVEACTARLAELDGEAASL